MYIEIAFILQFYGVINDLSFFFNLEDLYKFFPTQFKFHLARKTFPVLPVLFKPQAPSLLSLFTHLWGFHVHD